MKKSEKAQQHMKDLNERLAQERRKNPIIHKCEVCNYTAPNNHKPKLTRHLATKKHQDMIKSLENTNLIE
jgi:hypothetical protein